MWVPNFNSEEIKAAKETVTESQQFLSRQLAKHGSKLAPKLDRFLFHGSKSDNSSTKTDDNLLRKLDKMSLAQLSAYVAVDIQSMQDANAELKQKRSKGFRRMAAKVQHFAQTFNQFLSAYSGIVGILQTVDTQYGNVASATLSLLFVVCFWSPCSRSGGPDQDADGEVESRC